MAAKNRFIAFVLVSITSIWVISSLQCDHFGSIPLGYCSLYGKEPSVPRGFEYACNQENNVWYVDLIIHENDCNGDEIHRQRLTECLQSNDCYCSSGENMCDQDMTLTIQSKQNNNGQCTTVAHEEIYIKNECVSGANFPNLATFNRVILKATSKQVIAYAYNNIQCSGNPASTSVVFDAYSLPTDITQCIDIICDDCHKFILEDFIPSAPLQHQYPGEYEQHSNFGECVFNFPAASTNMNVGDTIDTSIAIIGGMLDALGAVNPAVGVISGIFSASTTIADLLVPSNSQDPSEEIYATMADMFNTLWQCTETYVEQAMSVLKDDIFDATQSRTITERITDLQVILSELSYGGKTDLDRWNSFEFDNIHDKIDNIVIEFLPTNNPKECRALIPLIIQAMNIKIFTYYIYHELGMEYDENLGIKYQTLPKSATFRRENVKLMKLYLHCAPRAYYHILAESLSAFSITQIEQEIDVIFSANAFCTWIEYTHLLSDITDSYNFDFVSGPDQYDFTIFSNCNRNMFEDLIKADYQTYITAGQVVHPVNNRQLIVKDVFDTSARKISGEIYYRTLFPFEWKFSDSCSATGNTLNPVPTCFNLDNEYNNGEYTFVDRGNRASIAEIECNGVCSNWASMYTKTADCDLVSRSKTGVRYIVEWIVLGEYYIPTIVGLEFLCTNLDYYDGYNTVAVFANRIEDNKYKWSPWVICPKGTQISMQIQGATSCHCEGNKYISKATASLGITFSCN